SSVRFAWRPWSLRLRRGRLARTCGPDAGATMNRGMSERAVAVGARPAIYSQRTPTPRSLAHAERPVPAAVVEGGRSIGPARGPARRRRRQVLLEAGGTSRPRADLR